MLDAARTPQYNPRGEKYLEAGQNDILIGNLISVRRENAIGKRFLISSKKAKRGCYRAKEFEIRKRGKCNREVKFDIRYFIFAIPTEELISK